jgi:hypothetical protein
MKKYLILVLIVLLIGALTVAVLADKKLEAGKSNIAHLYLYEKENFVEGGWDIVDGGAWGKMKYNQSGSTFDFVFNGHGLEAGVDYTLIYYPDKDGNLWPRLDIICLGSGTANGGGEVHIMGSVDTGDLPDPLVDINEGAKIWLILSNDELYCGEDSAKMVGWNPTEYLFEYELIKFDYTGD